jgi:hypothetical protein
MDIRYIPEVIQGFLDEYASNVDPSQPLSVLCPKHVNCVIYSQSHCVKTCQTIDEKHTKQDFTGKVRVFAI